MYKVRYTILLISNYAAGMPVLWLSQLAVVTATPDTLVKQSSRKHGATVPMDSKQKCLLLYSTDFTFRKQGYIWKASMK